MVSKSYRTDAIVLSTRRYQEADSLLLLLTPEKGKVSAIARGARKPTSKRAGKLQPFSFVEIQLYRGKSLQTVEQVDSKSMFSGILDSYEKFISSEAACELVSKAVPEGQESKAIFTYLLNFLSFIEKADSRKALVYALAFEFGMLYLLGTGPHLENCITCGRHIEQGSISLDPQKGGIVCGDCKTSSFEIPITVYDVRFLRLLKDIASRFTGKGFVASVNKSPKLRVTETGVTTLMNLIETLFSYQFDIEIECHRYFNECLLLHFRNNNTD